MRVFSPRITLRLAMFALPLAAIGFVSTHVKAQLSRPTPQIAEGPSEWVAFQATVRISHPGSPVVHGRFYRSSNGSDRLETGPAPGDIRVVSITNVPQRLRYIGHPGRNEWTRFAVNFPNDGKPPVAYLTAAWSRHPYRLALLKGQSGALDATEGLNAFSVKLNSGSLVFKVPELNFFEVVNQRPDGRHQIYFDIEFVEPDWTLFEPPPGAVVNERVPAAVPIHDSNPH